MKTIESLEVKEDLLSRKKLETVLKQLKNNEATGTDSVVNEF